MPLVGILLCTQLNTGNMNYELHPKAQDAESYLTTQSFTEKFQQEALTGQAAAEMANYYFRNAEAMEQMLAKDKNLRNGLLQPRYLHLNQTGIQFFL
jgi:hypothetical protein